MNTKEPINKLIESNKTLIDTNKELIQINKDQLKYIEDISAINKQMSVSFGKLYKYINSKNNQTWEERKISNELFEIVTQNNNIKPKLFRIEE